MTTRGAAHSFLEGGLLAKALIAHAPRKIALALGLLLTAGVTEAFGIFMIVPLLHVVGAAAHTGERSPFVEVAVRIADAVGVELTLPLVLVVFLALAAIRSATNWQRNILLETIRLGFVDQFREGLYGAIAGAKWEFLLGRRQSDLQHVLTSDVNRIGQGVYLMLQIPVTTVLVLAQLVLALLVSVAVSSAALLTGGILLFLTRPLVRRSRTLGEQLTGANQALFASVTDFLAGLKLAKSYTAEEPHVRHFTTTLKVMRERQLAFTWASSAAAATLNMGAAGALAAVAWFSISSATLTLPELLVMALVFVRVLPGLSRLQQNVQHLVYALPAYAHAREIQQALRAAAEAPSEAAQAPMTLAWKLSLRDVSFSYQDAARAALTGVDLDVPAGQVTAIAGPSGAGKSTLADILLGLLEPGDGTVRIDDAPLTGSNLSRWRRSVGYVPQEAYLFHDTIRANLHWARPGASEVEMWRSLRLAAAEDFVTALPDGLDTVVGDRGAKLSGGERQRIALARALIREPALLVLDEATSQLDAENERRILAALQALRGFMTIVVIAHRPALLEEADQIILLESGSVTSTGTWRELAERVTKLEGATEARNSTPGASIQGNDA